MGLQEVRVRPVELTRLESIVGCERTLLLEATAAATRDMLAGRRVINVNSTAAGGGVAELLQTLLATIGGLNIDARWVVIDGDPDFFAITKRIHNHLYGVAGDGGPLGPSEHERYEATLAPNVEEMRRLVAPGDIVVLHDPQTAGLAPALLALGFTVIWRCHVGIDTHNDHSRLAWEFLRNYIDDVPAFVFSCPQFAPEWMPGDRLHVIAPSIDPLSVKNEMMAPAEVVHTLQLVGLLEGETGRPATSFVRRDGSSGHVRHPVDLLGTGPVPWDAPVVLQASRWDALKDMSGVMAGFAGHLDDMGAAHLVLCGPSVGGVADDPEAAQILGRCLADWRDLPAAARDRVHLACVPLTDSDEAAAVVNALQRHAGIVVQKSLAEGFGLTVAEAMWKARPVVASAVGGMVDQIVDGETGYLLDDPADQDAFAAALTRLLDDPAAADRMGRNGKARTNDLFLSDRHLQHWAQLLTQLA